MKRKRIYKRLPDGCWSIEDENFAKNADKMNKEFYKKAFDLLIEINQNSHREICGICHRAVKVGFYVPDDIWKSVVHPSKINDIHCLSCFTERADEKLIAWDREIEFYPVSLKTHIESILKQDK